MWEGLEGIKEENDIITFYFQKKNNLSLKLGTPLKMWNAFGKGLSLNDIFTLNKWVTSTEERLAPASVPLVFVGTNFLDPVQTVTWRLVRWLGQESTCHQAWCGQVNSWIHAEGETDLHLEPDTLKTAVNGVATIMIPLSKNTGVLWLLF